MVSGRQKEFNKHMDDYIKGLSKKGRISSQRIFFPKRSAKPKPEVLEEEELIIADEHIGKGSIFSRIYDVFFGKEVTVVLDEEFEDEDIEEPEEEPKQAKPSYVQTIMKAMWGEKKPYVEPEPEIKKIVLVKPAAEQELKFVLKLMESLLAKMNKRDKEKFVNSREYKVYKNIKSKHS